MWGGVFNIEPMWPCYDCHAADNIRPWQKSNEIWEAAVMKLEESSVRGGCLRSVSRQVSPELHLLCKNKPFHVLQTIPSRLNIPKSCFQEAAWLTIRPEPACSYSTSAAADAEMGEESKHHPEKEAFSGIKGVLICIKHPPAPQPFITLIYNHNLPHRKPIHVVTDVVVCLRNEVGMQPFNLSYAGKPRWGVPPSCRRHRGRRRSRWRVESWTPAPTAALQTLRSHHRGLCRVRSGASKCYICNSFCGKSPQFKFWNQFSAWVLITCRGLRRNKATVGNSFWNTP